MDIFLAIASAIVIAWLSSLITVRIALDRFRTERWWEKKADAYSKLIGAIHDSKQFTIKHLEAQLTNKEVSEDEDKKLRKLANVAESAIKREMDIGSFYLSQNVMDRLHKYQEDMIEAGKAQMWFDYLQMDHEATKSCLDDIIVLAKDDLSIR